MYNEFKCFNIKKDNAIIRIEIDHKPINLIDYDLLDEFDLLTKTIEKDDDIKVAIFSSANPKYFMAHADLKRLSNLPDKLPTTKSLGAVHVIGERIRTMPKVSIAKIEGIARGGGSELALAMDMRFAAKETALLGQPEIGVGIIPGGGATQRLPRLIGRARALEVILSGDDFDATIAEFYGYINRALPAAELDMFVDNLAKRIAKFPSEAIRRIKMTVDSSTHGYADGLMGENFEFLQQMTSDDAKIRIANAFKRGAQTFDAELDLQTMLMEISDSPE